MTICSHAADTTVAFPVFDGHVDLLYSLQQASPVRPFEKTVSGPVTSDNLRVSDVRVLNSAIYCADHFNGSRSVQHLVQQLLLSEFLIGTVPIVRCRNTLECHWQTAGRLGQMLLLENADALVDLDIEFLETWGIITVGLTHIGSNRLADGNGVTNPTRLKTAGRRLVKLLESKNIVIDLAHLAEPGFWEVLDSFHGALCASHTGLRHFCDRPRNLNYDQIKALTERKGMIGLALAPEMLDDKGEADVETVFRHIDFLVDRFGQECIGLGTDLGGYNGVCGGLEHHGHLYHLVDRLHKAGYPAQVVINLFGKNWFKFYQRALSDKG